MATRRDNRWKAIIGMSSDHAGIDRELGRLRTEMYRALARLENATDVRDYVDRLRLESCMWLERHQELSSEK